jgi:Kef-type K+ transport system membrane component KefB
MDVLLMPVISCVFLAGTPVVLAILSKRGQLTSVLCGLILASGMTLGIALPYLLLLMVGNPPGSPMFAPTLRGILLISAIGFTTAFTIGYLIHRFLIEPQARRRAKSATNQ